MTFSDLLYLCAFSAAVVGVFLVAVAFLGLTAAFGAATLALAIVLGASARSMARAAEEGAT